MKLFCLQTTAELLKEFVEENYISINNDWLSANIERLAWEEVCRLYPEAANDMPLYLFFTKMMDGDVILLTDGNELHIGDAGDYYYVPLEYQSDKLPPRLHRRGVTWLRAVDLNVAQLASPLKELVYSDEPLAQLELPISLVTLESWISLPFLGQSVVEQSASEHQKAPTSSSHSSIIDEETIKLALNVLKQALASDDVERQERAALAILQYAASQQAANPKLPVNDQVMDYANCANDLLATKHAISTGQSTAQASKLGAELAQMMKHITNKQHN